MQRAVLYHRVSTVDQNPGLASAELRAAAATRGYTVVDEVTEIGQGGRSDRPGLLRTMAMAERGEIDAVLVWRLDRFGRSTVDLMTNLSRLRAAGVRFIATNQGIDAAPKNAQDAGQTTFFLTVLAACAEFERGIISQRVLLAARDAKQQGRPWGRKRTISEYYGKMCFELREVGLSYDQIAVAVRDKGGPVVTGTSVRRAVQAYGSAKNAA
jgi:DNA invertase Pin-like site-specific DNA recombinase